MQSPMPQTATWTASRPTLIKSCKQLLARWSNHIPVDKLSRRCCVIGGWSNDSHFGLYFPDCPEAAVPPSRRAVTIEQATELWEVIRQTWRSLWATSRTTFRSSSTRLLATGQRTICSSTMQHLDAAEMQQRWGALKRSTRDGSSASDTPR